MQVVFVLNAPGNARNTVFDQSCMRRNAIHNCMEDEEAVVVLRSVD